MAIDGIISGVTNFGVSNVKTNGQGTAESEKSEINSSEDGTISEITKDTRNVKNVNDSDEKDADERNQRQPSKETVQQAISDINKKLNNTECVFGVHEKTNRITIQIIDKESKKVIKEVPPEKTLDMIAKVWELAGILVDEKL